VVKAFNTVFAQTMSTGKVDAEPLTVLLAGNDAGAKRRVQELAEAIGFDAVDAGELSVARWLEALAFLNIHLGYGQNLGTSIGFRLAGAKKRVPLEAT
jgi:predicted dinucleotide-binding enzyme